MDDSKVVAYCKGERWREKGKGGGGERYAAFVNIAHWSESTDGVSWEWGEANSVVRAVVNDDDRSFLPLPPSTESRVECFCVTHVMCSCNVIQCVDRDNDSIWVFYSFRPIIFVALRASAWSLRC